MADGILAAEDLAATTETLLYTGPTDQRAFVVVNLCARTQLVTARIAITDDDSPTDADWIEYGVPLAPGGTPLIREGIILGAGHRIYAWASDTGVSATVYGRTEAV